LLLAAMGLLMVLRFVTVAALILGLSVFRFSLLLPLEQ